MKMATQALETLIVDDDAGDAEILCRRLDELDEWEFAVTVCHDPSASDPLWQNSDYGIVFLDYRMGAETGADLLRRIRGAGKTVPVVMLTGQGNEEIAVEAMKSGADDYVPKAHLSSAVLRRIVSNILEKRELRRRIEEQRKALLEAERLRVMFESIGAACHHLSQPLTAMVGSVELLAAFPDMDEAKKGKLLAECQKATNRMSDILARMKKIREYRTVPYLREHRILDIGSDNPQG